MKFIGQKGQDKWVISTNYKKNVIYIPRSLIKIMIQL